MLRAEFSMQLRMQIQVNTILCDGFTRCSFPSLLSKDYPRSNTLHDVEGLARSGIL